MPITKLTPSHAIPTLVLMCLPLAHVFNDSAKAQEASKSCFTIEESRQKIDAHKLTNPFLSIKAAKERMKGEPLTTRLCQHGDAFIYEITLLRPDGRIVKFHVDATTGRPQLSPKDE